VSGQEPPVDPGGREPGDDQDLLTYGEADARLEEVIREEQRQLAVLLESGADDAAVEATRRRIALLTEAAERNRRGASDATFRAWFGYDRAGRITPPR
jgi:hypothetical protein